MSFFVKKMMFSFGLCRNFLFCQSILVGCTLLLACICRGCVFNGKDTCIVEDLIFGHLLVRFESVSRQDFIRLFDSDELVGIDYFLILVPEHHLGVEFVSSLTTDVYIPP